MRLISENDVVYCAILHRGILHKMLEEYEIWRRSYVDSDKVSPSPL